MMQFLCQGTSHPQRVPDCNLQHWPVTKLFPPTTENVLLPQSVRTWSGVLMTVVDYHEIFELNWTDDVILVFNGAFNKI